jgi:tetratricopeptide (TPR) repeat protein
MNLKKNSVLLTATLLLSMTVTPLGYGFNLESAQAYNRALDLYIKGNTEEAIKEFETAVRLDPEFGDAFYNLGSIYRYTGNLAKAEECFQKVLAITPDDTSVNYDMALLYLQKKDYQKAMSFLKLVNKESPKYSEAQAKISAVSEEMRLNNIVEGKPETPAKIAITKPEETAQVEKKPEPQKIAKSEQATHARVNKEAPKKIVKKRNNLSKKERNEISEALINDYYLESANKPEAKKEPQQAAPVKEETQEVVQASNKEKFWEKYSKNSSSSNKPKKQSVEAKYDNEEVAVNFMSIEDTNKNGKLSISPQDTLKQVRHTVTNMKPVPRSAVKTFASGFNGPTGITMDHHNNIFIANYSENLIYKISAAGDKTIFANTEDINGPIGLAIDNDGNLYVANYLSNTIALVTRDGKTSTIVTGLNKPYFVYLDDTNSLYVSEQETNTISKINLAKRKGSI